MKCGCLAGETDSGGSCSKETLVWLKCNSNSGYCKIVDAEAAAQSCAVDHSVVQHTLQASFIKDEARHTEKLYCLQENKQMLDLRG